MLLIPGKLKPSKYLRGRDNEISLYDYYSPTAIHPDYFAKRLKLDYLSMERVRTIRLLQETERKNDI